MPSCLYCRRKLRTNRSTAHRQKACSRVPCQSARRRETYKQWIAKNPGYVKSRSSKQRAWAKSSDYWRKYRKENPDYYKKDLERRRKAYRHAAISAKPNGKGPSVREMVEELKVLKNIDFSAKPSFMDRRWDLVVNCLHPLARSAKPKDLAPAN